MGVDPIFSAVLAAVPVLSVDLFWKRSLDYWIVSPFVLDLPNTPLWTTFPSPKTIAFIVWYLNSVEDIFAIFYDPRAVPVFCSNFHCIQTNLRFFYFISLKAFSLLFDGRIYVILSLCVNFAFILNDFQWSTKYQVKQAYTSRAIFETCCSTEVNLLFINFPGNNKPPKVLSGFGSDNKTNNLQNKLFPSPNISKCPAIHNIPFFPRPKKSLNTLFYKLNTSLAYTRFSHNLHRRTTFRIWRIFNGVKWIEFYRIYPSVLLPRITVNHIITNVDIVCL